MVAAVVQDVASVPVQASAVTTPAGSRVATNTLMELLPISMTAAAGVLWITCFADWHE